MTHPSAEPVNFDFQASSNNPAGATPSQRAAAGLVKFSPEDNPSDSIPVSGFCCEEAKKRNLGIYYTPASTAEILATWALREAGDSVLEPSFGGCALLDAVVRRLSGLGCKEPSAQLRGFDLDPSAFNHLAQLLGNRATDYFALQDFLTASPNTDRDRVTAVVANPPFVSYHAMNERQRSVITEWRQRIRPAFSKSASLWAYFLVHSLQFLRKGGRLAYVLPSAALSADYARPVIEQLRDSFSRLALLSIREPIFSSTGAQVRAVVLLAEDFCPDGKRAVETITRTVDTVEDLAAVARAFATQNGAQEVTLTSGPVAEAVAILAQLQEKGDLCAIGDHLKVRIGEVVGDTQFFVKTATEWKELGIVRHLSPILTRMRQFDGLQLRSADVSESGTGLVPLLLKVQDSMPKQVKAYLNSYPEPAKSSNATFGKRTPWYSVSYDTSAKAFIGSLSHDGPRVVLNTARISCGNGLYKLTRSDGHKWHKAIAVACLSTVSQLSAEINARVRGAGAMKLEPSDVRAMVLPVSYMELSPKDSESLIAKADRALRRNNASVAHADADERLLVRPGLLSSSELDVLREALRALRVSRQKI